MKFFNIASYYVMAVFAMHFAGCGPVTTDTEHASIDNPTTNIEHASIDNPSLPQEIYDVIAQQKKLTVAEKDRMVKAVGNALEIRPKEQSIRDNAVEKAVLAHNGDKEQAEFLKKLVNKIDPILMAGKASKLPQNVYNIVVQSQLSIEQKNVLLSAVRLAMKNTIKEERTKAIAYAVKKLNGEPNLASAISKQLNKEAPLAKIDLKEKAALVGKNIGLFVLSSIVGLIHASGGYAHYHHGFWAHPH